jgi:hypothetical protein
MHYELQNILSGTQQVSHGAIIQTIADYLRRCQETSALVKTDKHFKSEETKKLIHFIDEHQLWVQGIDINLYLSEGAEQKVYLKDEKTVWKLNDTIYYLSWEDYFINLLLNNYFFTDTAYELTGFYENEKVLYSVVKQPFVKANQKTDLAKVKEFMYANGFLNTKNNDYYNPDLGIILEDLHDENVLTQNEILYFIDTVFYIK